MAVCTRKACDDSVEGGFGNHYPARNLGKHLVDRFAVPTKPSLHPLPPRETERRRDMKEHERTVL